MKDAARRREVGDARCLAPPTSPSTPYAIDEKTTVTSYLLLLLPALLLLAAALLLATACPTFGGR